MADKTVNLFGSQVKRGYVIAGAVVLGAAAVYGWYKNKKAAAAPAATSPSVSTAGDPYPPDGTTGNPSDPYSVDPATGQTYGDEADGGYTGNGVSNLGGYYGGSGLYGSGTGYEQPGEFTSNAYWTQYCEQMMGSSGDDSISAALGAYVTGAPLSTSEISIVEQAIAIAGYPPVAGPGGYPPSIQTGPSGSAGTGTAPTGTTGTGSTGTTGTGGGSAPPASQPPPARPPTKVKPPAAPSRIDISGTTSSTISCHWTDVPGATSYHIQVTYQSKTVQDLTASSYSTVIRGLTPDHTYGIHVSSVGPGGTSSPAATWAKTTK